jgi:hypothetical protein
VRRSGPHERMLVIRQKNLLMRVTLGQSVPLSFHRVRKKRSGSHNYFTVEDNTFMPGTDLIPGNSSAPRRMVVGLE